MQDMSEKMLSGSRDDFHSYSRDSRHRHDDRHEEDRRKRHKSPNSSPRYDERDREHYSRRHHHHHHRHSSDDDILPLDEWPKKLKNWDVPPHGMEHMSIDMVKATGLFVPAAIQPKVTNLTPFVDPNRVIMTQNNIGDISSITANLNPLVAKQNRRIYLGGLPSGISEHDIIVLLNRMMSEHGLVKDLSSDSCIQEVILKSEYGYAFVDFKHPEEATAAMSLDGADFQGVPIKVRRPKDYQIQDGTITPVIPDSPNKIYIGSIPCHITEDQLSELLSTFGELKFLYLIKDSSGTSKGYAFCEYSDSNITDIACKGLHELELGDKKLIVQRASIASKPLQSSILPHLTLLTDQSTAASTVLQLMNMIAKEELLDDDEYQDILDDIKSECEKYGIVQDIYIPRPSNINDDDPIIGRVFIQYATADHSIAASKALTGRKFADRIVMTAYYPEDLFKSRKFYQ